MQSKEANLMIKTSLLSAVFTVVFLMLINYFFNHTWNPFFISQSKVPPFTVQGTGTAMGVPDESNVSFTITKTAVSLKVAQKQANTQTNTIVHDLQTIGVAKKNIQTTNYNVAPNYNNNEPSAEPGIYNMPMMPAQPVQSQTIVSYTVSENVAVTIHNNMKVNEVIDTLTKDGAENISGPNLTFSDAKQQQLENQARIMAIDNAKEKAQSISAAAGIHLGTIIGVQENPTNVFYPMAPMMVKAAGATSSGGSPTQINPGQNSVTDSVTLTYQTN